MNEVLIFPRLFHKTHAIHTYKYIYINIYLYSVYEWALRFKIGIILIRNLIMESLDEHQIIFYAILIREFTRILE